MEDVFRKVPKVLKNYTIGRMLGSGSFSEVYVAQKIRTGEAYAIKFFPKSNLKDQKDEARFQREIDAMAYLKYDNLVSMHDFFWDETNFYLVLDYCQGGELFDYIVSNGKVSEPVAAIIFQQIAGAVAFCHSYGVAHRDLKPENILITEFPHVKISDFGLCGYLNETKLMQTFCGSPCYCAPECLNRINYDGRLSDIWSMGVILYSMVTGEHPWTVSNPPLMIKQISRADFALPSYLTPECKSLIKAMLQLRPKQRLSLDKILAHPWFKYRDWALVNPPANLDTALSSLRVQQPLSLEKISSSSSRSSHKSDHGIVSPFDDDELEEIKELEEPISLESIAFSNIPTLKYLSSSMEKIETKDPNRRKFIPQSPSMRNRRATIVIPKIKPTFMDDIKE